MTKKVDRSKLSKKYQASVEAERALFEQGYILSDDDPRLDEAMERMANFDMDLHYRDRQLTKAMQDVMEQSSNSKYSVTDRIKAVMTYVVTGSAYKTSELVGVPVTTLHKWKTQAKWWPAALEYAREAVREDIKADLYEVQTKALEAVKEALEHGDEVVNVKTGEKYRKNVTARDAMHIAAMAHDKQRIMNGEATKITQTSSQQDALAEIANSLKKLTATADEKIIEGVVIKE